MEADAEAERMAQRRQRRDSRQAEKSGETLLDLIIFDSKPALGGRQRITFIKRNREIGLPWNRLRVGAPVIVSRYQSGEEESWPGVVCKRNMKSLQVVLSRLPDSDAKDKFRIDLSPDEITRKRMLAALGIAKMSRGRLGKMREALMGERELMFGSPPEVEFSKAAKNDQLNPSQQAAIQFALSAQDLAIVHGPPGTGKTTTIVELIIQAVKRGDKVLACAPSNTAVDNLLMKLHQRKQKVVRIGHPARVSEHLQGCTLDGLLAKHESMRVIKEMFREADELFRLTDRYSRTPPPPGAKRAMRDDAKRLRRDARMMEQQAIEYILDRSDIICSTTTFDETALGDRWFDLAVIDEACQSTEPGCWIPICRSDKVVFAGDHCQLPPTVVSKEAAKEGFALSLMERQIKLHGEAAVRMLNEQYRMNEKIMQFSSEQFYDGELTSHESVANHTLEGIFGITADGNIEQPVMFVDTAGASWDEELEPDGESKRNPQEADFILQRAIELNEKGVPFSDMAVIVPYAAQVRLVRGLASERLGLEHDLEIDTVDGFQGREKEAVLISLVRSNDKGEIGFLSDTRRMNVALTRARRKLIVIGDSATLSGKAFYDDLFAYFDAAGSYRSIWEFIS